MIHNLKKILKQVIKLRKTIQWKIYQYQCGLRDNEGECNC